MRNVLERLSGSKAGKTTMLNALAGSIPAHERVVSCEEVWELRLPVRDQVAMQCRQESLEGTGEIPLRRLVKEALRMRPDRIVIGEVREAEAFDLLVALNSGIPGMCTVHASSAREAVVKMTTLPLLAGENVTDRFVVPTVASAVDVVVHLAIERGRRVVREILAVTGRAEDGVVETATLFRRDDQGLRRADGMPPHLRRFADAGIDIHAVLAGHGTGATEPAAPGATAWHGAGGAAVPDEPDAWAGRESATESRAESRAGSRAESGTSATDAGVGPGTRPNPRSVPSPGSASRAESPWTIAARA
ncbi:hypothetical protein GCM10027059_50740 [Myceligenerans halotolerans]